MKNSKNRLKVTAIVLLVAALMAGGAYLTDKALKAEKDRTYWQNKYLHVDQEFAKCKKHYTELYFFTIDLAGELDYCRAK